MGRALRILAAFVPQSPQLELAEISRSLGLPKSTAHRLLATLESTGFVSRGAGGHYHLGIAAAQIGAVALDWLRSNESIRSELRALNAETLEMINLTTLLGGKVVVVERVDSTEPLRISVAVDLRRPPYCTSSGKVLLAFSGRQKELVRQLRFRRFTSNTITTSTRFLKELKHVREAGYAVDRDESYDGVSCLAVPIPNSSGDVAFALSLSGPSTRVREERFPDLVDRLRRRARAIALAMDGTRSPQ